MLVVSQRLREPGVGRVDEAAFADIARIKAGLRWQPKVAFEKGVEVMLSNLDYWRDAPVWTADKIAETTRAWFDCLSPHSQAAE